MITQSQTTYRVQSHLERVRPIGVLATIAAFTPLRSQFHRVRARDHSCSTARLPIRCIRFRAATRDRPSLAGFRSRASRRELRQLRITGHFPLPSGRNTSARRTMPSSIGIGRPQSTCIASRIGRLRGRFAHRPCPTGQGVAACTALTIVWLTFSSDRPCRLDTDRQSRDEFTLALGALNRDE